MAICNHDRYHHLANKWITGTLYFTQHQHGEPNLVENEIRADKLIWKKYLAGFSLIFQSSYIIRHQNKRGLEQRQKPSKVMKSLDCVSLGKQVGTSLFKWYIASIFPSNSIFLSMASSLEKTVDDVGAENINWWICLKNELEPFSLILPTFQGSGKKRYFDKLKRSLDFLTFVSHHH